VGKELQDTVASHDDNEENVVDACAIASRSRNYRTTLEKAARGLHAAHRDILMGAA